MPESVWGRGGREQGSISKRSFQDPFLTPEEVTAVIQWLLSIKNDFTHQNFKNKKKKDNLESVAPFVAKQVINYSAS